MSEPPSDPSMSAFRNGDRVVIDGEHHPWKGHSGEVVETAKVHPGWSEIVCRIRLDAGGTEAYAGESELTRVE